jgi:arabinose-5-phosphate isomerase
MILEQAKEVLKTEAQGILSVMERLGDSFVTMVDWIDSAKGRVIVAGIGKSGLVGRKMVATLNSTGTPSLFLHPVEAMHGDLGMVGPQDVFLALSNSGETDELNALIPSIRRIGCPVIALTGGLDSTLAKSSDLVVDVRVEKEACPMGLAPTTSTTTLMAVGDALAVVLMHRHHFESKDFKLFHPGGALGRRLSAKVADMMLTGESIPVVSPDTLLNQAMICMNETDLGATLVAEQGVLKGIITDGDLRRMLLSGTFSANMTAAQAMTPDPKAVTPDSLAGEALNIMEKHLITVLPVIGPGNTIAGIVHLHDILGKGALRFNGS